MKKHQIDTPALLIDASVLRRNIESMQELANSFAVRLRPHTKTHKSPQIARLQLAAGAAGITVAKIGEAEVMAEAGIQDILIANQIVTPHKIRKLVELAGAVRLAVLVDSQQGVEVLQRMFAAADERLDVLIEVDTGKGRCGLRELGAIVELADAVSGSSHLRLRGVETHEGHVPAAADSSDQLEQRSLAAGRRLLEVAQALRERGHQVDEVSVGSTPAAPYTARLAGITEMRPGTYVFNDVNQICLGQARPGDCALSVQATVISRPAPDRAVLDAGSKSLFAESARRAFACPNYDGYGYIREAPSARITSLSEEHGVVNLAAGTAFPAIGELVEVIPNHVCPAVNLHEIFYVVEGEDVVETWPIAARGKVS